MAEYKVRGETVNETVTADDWRVCDDGNVVFYTGDEKVAYYRNPVSVKTIPPTDEVTRLQKDVARQVESRDYWRWMYHQSKDKAALGKIRELEQELETAQAAANSWKEGRDYWAKEYQRWHDKYTELSREVHPALRDKAFWQTRCKGAEATIKDLRQELETAQANSWKEYKEAETTIKDLRRELEAREAAVKYLRDGTASLEDLREAQRERDSWHHKYDLLTAKLRETLDD